MPVTTLGRYLTLKTRNKHKYIHKIEISNKILTEYLLRVYQPIIVKTKNYKKYCIYKTNELKEILKNTIKHEIIHAFVKERFRGKYNYARDASPIFLSILDFLSIESGHKAAEQYRYSKIKEYLADVKDFNELLEELFTLEFEYDQKFRDLEVININNNILCLNYFNFNQGDNAGLTASSTTIVLDKNEIAFKYNVFEVGCNITPCMIKQLVERKLMSNTFKVKKYTDLVIGLQISGDLKVNRLNFKV
ncbi:hypothetical protein G9F71_016410 [Clostridium sp. FP2]|uniref:hypothetical protein n=1 Tax=Clostridium sp. FP2 TaxID=2724481 RepID=UPI0013E924F1|nr:hypothetical protein [Clostridium sp. FP2]MBZ9624435.1 hypothetical protein [Clostridium sp. FP2]